MRPDRDAPVVVAGIGESAFPLTLAALRAGHRVVRLVTGPHELPDDADDRAARLAAAAPAERLAVTGEAADAAGFAVAVLTEPPAAPGTAAGVVSAVEQYAAALAPQLRGGGLLVVSSATASAAAEHTDEVVDATVELITGLRAGRDYALAHLFPPAADGRLVVSGVDHGSTERARAWLDAVGLVAVPVMPTAAAEVVATVLARADPPSAAH